MPKLDLDTRIVEMELGDKAGAQALGRLSGYTCPECNGPIWVLQEGKLERFRCQVGHGYSFQTMVRGKYDYLEQLMAMTINAYEEIYLMSKEFAAKARKQSWADVARRFEQEARQAKGQAEAVRTIFRGGTAPLPEGEVQSRPAHPKHRRGGRRR